MVAKVRGRSLLGKGWGNLFTGRSWGGCNSQRFEKRKNPILEKLIPHKYQKRRIGTFFPGCSKGE